MTGSIKQFRNSWNPSHSSFGITMGKVVDTNDPLNSHRVRAFCPTLGDHSDHSVGEIPWAVYASPFGGTSFGEASNAGQQTSKGGVPHGMTMPVSLGSYVLVTCVDGDPNHRFYFAAAMLPNESGQQAPHGNYNQDPKTGKFDGPLTSAGKPLQPAYDNNKASFSKTSSKTEGTPGEGHAQAFEWFSRGMDYSAGIIRPDVHASVESLKPTPDTADGKIPVPGGGTRDFVNGYARSRLEEGSGSSQTGGVVYDPSVYSIVTPGFHAIAMDDRPENSRVRFRTTSGTQILMDDTNERIYIQTAQGNNWIELDHNGNIDIYSARRISISSDSDINLSADGAIRMRAAKGIHLTSETEIRMNSLADTNINAEGSLRVRSTNDFKMESAAEVHVTSGTTLNLTSTANFNLKSNAEIRIESVGMLNLKSGAEIHETASKIHHNGPEATPADLAKPANPKHPWLPNRQPEHEPWPRNMFVGTDNDGGYAVPDPAVGGKNVSANEQKQEFPYDSPEIGKSELGEAISRNKRWNR